MSANPNYSGRTDRLVTLLLAADSPLTVRQCADATGDEYKAVHTTLYRLLRDGRLCKHPGRRGQTAFSALPNARITRRARNTAGSPARARSKARAIKPPPGHRQPAAPPAPAGLAATPDIARDQIAADIRAFLARGGRIEKLRNGDSAFNRDLRGGSMKDHNESAWKKRQEDIGVAA